MNPGRSPNWIAVTLDGRQSALEGIFNAALGYDGVRASILQHLHNGDFNAMRAVCRSIDHCLMTPASGIGPHRLRYQPDLIDRCHESNLPVPPSLPPDGSCPNVPGSWCRVIPCQLHNYLDVMVPYPRHGSGPHLVCYNCRRNWHHSSTNLAGNTAPKTRHEHWRRIIAIGHITVCRLCDREQKASVAPEGFDGCTCYRELYMRRWLCRACDVCNENLANRAIGGRILYRSRLKQVARYNNSLRREETTIQVMPAAQVPKLKGAAGSWCPCWRRGSESEPPPVHNIPFPFTGNQDLILPAQTVRNTKKTTKQCVRCCGYIVPPAAGVAVGTRRSARLADGKLKQHGDRKHQMLGSQAVNGKGFSAREPGGWA